MHDQRSHQRKAGALDELPRRGRPLACFSPTRMVSDRTSGSKGVANGPAVEVATPAVHLCGRYSFGFGDKRCQHAGFRHARGPECGGEFVISPKTLRQQANVGHRNAKRISRRNAVSRHAFAVRLVAWRFSHVSAGSTSSSSECCAFVLAAFAGLRGIRKSPYRSGCFARYNSPPSHVQGNAVTAIAMGYQRGPKSRPLVAMTPMTPMRSPITARTNA